MSDTRQHVHELVDQLSQDGLNEVERLLESRLQDEEEELLVEEAKEWLRQNPGKTFPHEEVLADFGLTMEDFKRMGEQRAKRRLSGSNGKTD
jgi:hypothetical protein